MKENKDLTKTFLGTTDNDFTDWLDEQGIDYTWEFKAIGNKSYVKWENKIAVFEKNILKRVLTK